MAHFDYYFNTGSSSLWNTRGVVLIPMGFEIQSKMNNTTTTVGGYKASIANTTTCPAIANALSTVLGSYLLTRAVYITNDMNANISSMAGANLTGAAVSCEWVNTQCVLPNDVQLLGTMTSDSSIFDIGEANRKLALFNIISPSEYGAQSIYLRGVCSSGSFTALDGLGYPYHSFAGTERKIRPLIYIG